GAHRSLASQHSIGGDGQSRTWDRRRGGQYGIGSPLHWAFRFFFFQAEDGIRDYKVTGVQTCALPICLPCCSAPPAPALPATTGWPWAVFPTCTCFWTTVLPQHTSRSRSIRRDRYGCSCLSWWGWR